MTTTLAITAYDRIRELLAAGEFPPGCHLVNQELSRRIGVGLTPVREAVTRLASEGLLQHMPGAGVFVRRPTMADVLQLCDLRALLEPYAVQQSAEHRTEGDLREMRAVLDEEFRVICEVAKLPERRADQALVQRWILIERRFHGMIIDAARNPWLAKVVADVSLLSTIFSPDRADSSAYGLHSMVASWRDHRRLVRLIRRRSGAEAAELLRRHLALGRSTTERFLVERVASLRTGSLREADAWPADFQPLARRRGRPPGRAKAVARQAKPPQARKPRLRKRARA